MYKYNSNNEEKFAINLLDLNKLNFIEDTYYNQQECFDIDEVDTDKVYDKIINSRHDELIQYIEQIRFKINELTNGFLTKDFLYHYIINQYSLNTLNHDMYHNSLQSDEFNDEDLYKILMVMGNILCDLNINESMTLFHIMKNISMCLNTVQGIRNFNCNRKDSRKLNNEFKKYCEKIGVSFSKGWEMVVNRNKNFDIQEHINQKDLAYKAMVAIGYNIFN